jgi:UPF0716 family protein affecting phage T7 exclusion
MGERSRTGRVLGVVAVLLLVIAAFAAGMATERMRFDAQRGKMLERWDAALKAHQQQLMQSEKAGQ